VHTYIYQSPWSYSRQSQYRVPREIGDICIPVHVI
jgi:hypothetical protein